MAAGHGKGGTAVEQAHLLLVAMAERCLAVIQNKPEDKRFALPPALRPDHLRWMCQQVVEHAEHWPTSRSHRWIGFIQAGMMANYMLDLAGVKALFHQIRKQYGDIANDQDLLDHLDPTNPFELETGGEG